MLSAARFAAVGMVGRPLTHVVRDAFCEGNEGIAEVREQHRYPPTASAVRECGGNVVGVLVGWVVVGGLGCCWWVGLLLLGVGVGGGGVGGLVLVGVGCVLVVCWLVGVGGWLVVGWLDGCF